MTTIQLQPIGEARLPGLGALPLILASRSPRRAELLQQIGIPFEVFTMPAEEARFRPGQDTPEVYVETSALKKMDAVRKARPGRLILGADTLVTVDGKGLGKPKDREEAVRMLLKLSEKTHEVFTGVALGYLAAEGRSSAAGPVSPASRVDHCVTRVTFRNIPRQRAEAYVATGEPMDKAGAYGIQGKGACLVERMEGCYFNVVGLPLPLVTTMLEAFGVSVFQFWRETDHA